MRTITTDQKIKIHPETTVNDLLLSWVNGSEMDRRKIIETLSYDHPGLTAFFLLEGIRRCQLNEVDCNRIVNNLIDIRKALFDITEAKQDVVKDQWPSGEEK